MSRKDYFIVGCKLFGVYCFVISIPHFLSLFQLFISPQDLAPELSRILAVAKIATAIVPIAYLLLGGYLITDGHHLYNFAFPNEKCVARDLMKEKFIIFLKMLGMFLVIRYFPDFFKTIANFWAFQTAPEYIDMFFQKKFTALNVLPSFVGIFLGFYLVRSGEIFVKFGFRGSRKRFS